MNIVESGIPAVVEIVDPASASRKSVIDELKELKAAKKQKRYVTPVDSDFSLHDLKKVPKEKTKKPKKKKKKEPSLPVTEALMELRMQMAAQADSLSPEEEEAFPNGRTISDILQQNDGDEDDRGLKDLIIDKQKGKHSARHKDGTKFSKRFADQMTLLYDMLSESNDMSSLLTKQVKQMLSTKTRAVSRTTVDMAEVALSANNNRLAIIKEINSTNKTISDLELKEETMNQRTKKDEGATDTAYAGTHFLQQVLNMGRKNILGGGGVNSGAVGSGGMTNTGAIEEDYDDDEYEDDNVNTVLNLMNAAETTYGELDMENFQDVIERRLQEEGNPSRTSDGSKYIKYETLEVQIYVYQCIDTQDWEFIAVDKYNQRVPDYPLPSRLDTGKLKFSQDNTYATDERGRMYKVKTYFSNNEEQD